MLPVKPHIQTILYKTAKDILKGAKSRQDDLKLSMTEDFARAMWTFCMCSLNKL